MCSYCSELKDSKWKFKNSEETKRQRQIDRQKDKYRQRHRNRDRQTDIERQREHMWVENKILFTLL